MEAGGLTSLGYLLDARPRVNVLWGKDRGLLEIGTPSSFHRAVLFWTSVSTMGRRPGGWGRSK
jgi:hypothetical protein